MKSGVFFADRQHVAMTTYFAEKRRSMSVSIVHRFVSSSKSAAVTRVLNWMSLRRSNLSAT